MSVEVEAVSKLCFELGNHGGLGVEPATNQRGDDLVPRHHPAAGGMHPVDSGGQRGVGIGIEVERAMHPVIGHTSGHRPQYWLGGRRIVIDSSSIGRSLHVVADSQFGDGVEAVSVAHHITMTNRMNLVARTLPIPVYGPCMGRYTPGMGMYGRSVTGMTVTAVTIQKGGVGKTATAVNTAAAMAESGRRVLLVDLDPQGHGTVALGITKAPERANLAAALLGQYDGDLGDLLAPVDGLDTLAVLPNSDEMFLLESQLHSRPAREMLLARLLDAYAVHFDDIIIDCPPSLGVLTDSALYAARTTDSRRGRIVIPVQAEDSSLDALRLLLAQIATLTDAFDIDIAVAGLVVNVYDSRRGTVATTTMDAFQRHELPVLATIGDRKEIREVWRRRRPVAVHAPDSVAAQWYRDLAARLNPSEVAA